MALPLSQSGQAPRTVAQPIITEAGEIALAHFFAEKEIVQKGRGNVVTNVDLLLEKHLVTRLRQEFPTFGFLTEESPAIAGDSNYTWIIDPLDGTRNYASGIPYFCISLALVQGEEVLLGLTYDPVRREHFWAEKGGGAFCNERRLAVARKPNLQASLIGFDMGYHDDRARESLETVLGFWPGIQSMRVMGSAALSLAYVAAGRLDLYFHGHLYPWDVACGLLLVTEAGGKITDRQGGPFTIHSSGAIAANEAVHADFLKRSQTAPSSRCG